MMRPIGVVERELSTTPIRSLLNRSLEEAGYGGGKPAPLWLL